MRIKANLRATLEIRRPSKHRADYFKTLRVALSRAEHLPSRIAQAPNALRSSRDCRTQVWPDETPSQRDVGGVGWSRTEYGEIVGVVGDVKYGKVEEVFKPQVYLPYLQPTEPASFVLVRTTNDPAQIVSGVRGEILALDKERADFDIRHCWIASPMQLPDKIQRVAAGPFSQRSRWHCAVGSMA